jgi:hypothetical protein
MQADRLQPILDVAVARFEREQALREELRDAQTKLVERKVVERAKGFLMQQKGVSEDEAFRLLRKLAMDRNAKAARGRTAGRRRRRSFSGERKACLQVVLGIGAIRAVVHAYGAVQHDRRRAGKPRMRK